MECDVADQETDLRRRQGTAAISGAALHPVAFLGLVFFVIAFWMIQHPYVRIVHDSILYTFAALARLHPHSLGHDVYLTLGVQDRYTIFSPLIAPLIRLLGVEPAASLVTFVAQVAFFGCGWLLARRLMPSSQALFALALLVMLPAIYGDRHIFSYIEGFMTPRLPSEAFVLGTLVAVLARRYVMGAVCLLGATILHPIMAAAGFVMVFMLLVVRPRPWIGTAITLTVFATVVIAAYIIPVGPIARFDPGWFQYLYKGGSYLFPTEWKLDDWAHASIPLCVLATGCRPSMGRDLQAVCVAALLTGLSGLLASLLGTDMLRVILVTQVQPWRWLWLANALAVLVTPAVLLDCWRGKGATSAATILLAAAWVGIDEPYAPIIGMSAVLISTVGPRVTHRAWLRLIFVGSWIALGLQCLVLAQFVLGVVRDLGHIRPDRTLYSNPYLLWLRKLKPWQAGGIVPACIFFSAWWAATHRRNLAVAVTILALGLTLCVGFGEFSWNSWINWPRAQFSQKRLNSFAPWRRAIPPRAQVLWGDTAVPTWFLLHRASYWSREQTAASVFSEPMARLLARRSWIIRSIDQSSHNPNTALVRTCQSSPKLAFVVSTVNAGPTPYPLLNNPQGHGKVRLYRCADYRK